MLSTDIIAYLTAQNVGGRLYNAFHELEGGFAGTRTVITPYGGREPIEVQDEADARIDIARFQAITEGLDPAVTEQEAHRVQRELARVRNQTINGTFYLKITPLQPPFFLGWSETQSGVRQISYGSNYEVMKQPYLGL